MMKKAVIAIILVLENVHAEIIKVPWIDSAISSIISTIQFYSTLIGGLTIVGLGVSLIFSGDDSNAKAKVLRCISALTIGLVLVWGGPFIADQIRNIAGGR